jgi:hypothetical protein
MYTIILTDDKKLWMNERLIQKIVPNEDGTFTLHHFNNNVIIIKSFSIYK